MMRKIILSATFLLFCFVNFTVAAEDVFVRVAILRETKGFALSIRGKFDVMDAEKGKLLGTQKGLRDVMVVPDGDAIKIGEESYRVSDLKIIPHQRATVTLNNKQYRGTIEIIRSKDGKAFLVVNAVELERYVKGVLYHEMPYYWPMEALKSQAVVARTYAVYRTQISQKELYDVTSDIYSQVYGGRSAERYRSNIAVNRTRGEVIFYKDKIIPAFFHATCGGATEDAAELWNVNLPPLRGVECPFCVMSPHYRWKKNFRSQSVQETLNQRGYKLGLIKEIKVTERDRSGRIRKLQIITRDKKTVEISGKDFREIIGPNVLKSNFYDIEMKGYYFDIIGRGWGHGAGMCQWGVYGMAQQRYRYEQILQYYYPSSEIIKYKKNLSK